jgi:hypothetical protein
MVKIGESRMVQKALHGGIWSRKSESKRGVLAVLK